MVELRFIAEAPESTRAECERRALARHAAGGGEYRAALASEQGWPYILSRYAAAAKRT